MFPAPATVAAVTVLVMASVVLLVPAPAYGGQCDPLKDIVVKETAGDIQLDGAKKYGVTVINQAAAAVSGVQLACGYDFRHVDDDDVDPRVIVQVAHDDCLLIGGGAIAPGGNVSFAYTSYVSYDMHVLAATCASASTASSLSHKTN